MKPQFKIEKCLYSFQRDGVEYALTHHYSINACEMGLGKTIQSIAVAERVGGPTLIVCPAYLKQNWLDELVKWETTTSYEVVSYHQVITLKNVRYKTIIVDEAHYLKNMQAKRTKAAHKFVKSNKPDYLLLLTGTPIKNRVSEFYSLMKLCSYNPKGTSGEVLAKGFTHFAQALSNEVVKHFNGVRVVSYEGLRNKPLLIKYLKGKYFRRIAADELDLPRLTKNRVLCGDIPVGGQLFDQFKTGAKHLSTAKSDLALLKATYTVKYIEELLNQEISPILVYSDHVRSANYIGSNAGRRGGHVRVITGATPSKTRADLVAMFQAGKIDVLVATIGSLATGFTLTATNRIIFNDISWVPADNLQAQARIHRIGQTRPCFVTQMVGVGVDTMINDAISAKMEVLNATM